MRPLPLALFAATALALLAGAARDRTPAATPNGAARSCIPIYAIRNTEVRSDRVIDFITTGRRAYRNVLPHDCPGLGFEQHFAYETSLSQLCSTDIITVFSTAPIQRGASCGLGQFQPVTLAHR